MSKAPVEFDFREALTSSEHNDQTYDYIRPGRVVWHFTGDIDDAISPVYMGWYLYNPAKQVADRMRVLGFAGAVSDGLETSIDSGASWQALALGSGGIPATVLVTAGGTTAFTGLLEFGDVSLAGIPNTQWIGVRELHTTPVLTSKINYWCMLYNNTQDPF